MARRATSFGPNPPCFFFCFFFLFFCFCLVFCFGRFKGQVRWPKRPPHLALNPPNLFIYCFFCLFLFISFLCFVIQQNLCSPWKRAFLFVFECLPLFLLSFFWPPPFSICLSLFLSSSCPLFLPSCFFFVCFVLLPCFCFFVSFFSSLFLFHETNNIRNIDVQKFSSSFFLVSCLLFSLKFIFHIFVFS